MKKTLAAFMLFLPLAAGVIVAPRPAAAADIGIGASLWCAWWRPSWAEAGEGLFPKFKVGPNVIGGPMLTVRINDAWGISASYAYGSFTGTSALMLPVLRLPVVIDIERKAGRHEVDLIAACSLHKYAKIFFGAKYWGYESESRASFLAISMKSLDNFHFAGPGVGLSFTIPLYKNFYLVPNVSGMCQFGPWKPLSSPLLGILNRISGNSPTVIMYSGVNSTLSFVYYIEKANLTVALGGRFQYAWIKNIGTGKTSADGLHDLFAGITLAAVYTFTVSGSPDNRTAPK